MATSTSEDEVSEDDESWANLPNVALAKVFFNLSDIDRLNMACVCSSWYGLFASPILWRDRRVVFSSLNAERLSEKERKFIQRFGQYLRKLTLGFGTPTFKSCMDISKAADSYIKCICCRNDVNLREIDLDHMHMEQHWHFILSRNRLVTAICKMLRRQKHLQSVYITGARARVHDGCRILESLAKGPTCRSITTLYMEDLFETNVFPCRQSRYIRAMSKFVALEQLQINYKYLNSDVLRNMANKLSHSLQTLSIVIEGDVRGLEIAPDAWYEFSERCPRAELHVYLCTTLFRGNDLRPPFVRGMPMTECYLTSWSRVDEHEDRLGALLRHIGRTYPSKLDNFAMFFERHDPLDRDLLLMLGRCSNIRDLCLQLRISADTVINVMKLHHKRKLSLFSLNLTIFGLTENQWERINQEKERLVGDIPDFLHIGPGESDPSSSGSNQGGIPGGAGVHDPDLDVDDPEVLFDLWNQQDIEARNQPIRVDLREFIEDADNEMFVPRPRNPRDPDQDQEDEDDRFLM